MSRCDQSHWNALWHRLNAQGDAAAWHHRLITAYSEPARRYHNLRHLEECLAEFDATRTLARKPDLVAMALWFHDAIYDPRSTTNEDDSAQLAVDCLSRAGAGPAAFETVRLLVLSTKTHGPGGVPDAELVSDIDLSIFGQPAARFGEYERDIAAEYAWVPAAEFAAKRAEVLNGFLSRRALYHTDYFRKKYEATARANLKAAVVRLRQARAAAPAK